MSSLIFFKSLPLRLRSLHWFVKILISLIVTLLLLIVLLYLIPLQNREYNSGKDITNVPGVFYEHDGYSGYYLDSQPNEPKIIVFLHGFGSSSATWKDISIKLNEAGFRTIAVDLKGFGLSQKGYDVDYSHSSQAEYVISLLQELGIKQATFVSHSMGGNVLLHLASKEPELVEKMIFFGPAVVYSIQKNTFDWTDIPLIQRAFQQIFPRYFSTDRAKQILGSAYYRPEQATDEVLSRYTQAYQIKDWELSLLGMIRDSKRNAISVDSVPKATPSLVIWGKNDSWVPISESEKLLSLLENEKFIVLEETGHVPHEERPEEVVKIMKDFL